ncbi:5'-3' exonuclease H3TH domain-containing protein [Porticoccaceae bacterium LTM1]|nr:5'-3' exonuclease H3TH domain-containing protein [Porticoccaceae bacterium LTM1]
MSIRPIYLIDASIYIFKSYFALPDNWVSEGGYPTNAVYGYTLWLLKLLEAESPTHLAAAYDESLGSGFRHRLCPNYKANRVLPDEALAFQLNACREVAELLGITSLASDEYEADDIVGTLASISRSEGFCPTLLSRDKDLAQLLAEGEVLWDYGSAEPRTVADLEAHFQVPVSRLADYLALVGDAIDNIAGVPGIGPKTAAAIIGHYSSIDAILEDPDQLANLKVRGAKTLADKIVPWQDQLLLSRQLTKICCDAPLGICVGELLWRGIDRAGFTEFCQRMGLGSRLIKRAEGLKSA